MKEVVEDGVVTPVIATLLEGDRAEVEDVVEGLVVATEGTRSGSTFVHAF